MGSTLQEFQFHTLTPRIVRKLEKGLLPNTNEGWGKGVEVKTV